MRAIDRHEYKILEVLDACDDGATLIDACAELAPAGMSAERLAHLVRVWCAVGSVLAPD